MRNPPRAAFTLIELLVATAIMGILSALMLPAILTARETARRGLCRDHLRQIGLALHSYVEAHESWPAGVINRSGPIRQVPDGDHHGWVLALLPFLDQPLLADRLRTEISIYAKEHRTPRQQLLEVLLCPSDSGPVRSDDELGAVGLSSYAGCHHGQSGPIDSGNNGLLFLNGQVRAGEIPDGACCTFAVGEIRRSATDLGWASGTRATLRNTGIALNATADGPLSSLYQTPLKDTKTYGTAGSAPAVGSGADTAPVEARPAAQPPVPELPWRFLLETGGFGSFHLGGSQFLLADGRVRFISESISTAIYQQLGDRQDGLGLRPDQF